jgi:hypothetical protein
MALCGDGHATTTRNRMMKNCCLATLFLLLWPGSTAGQAVPRVELGWGIDLELAPWTDVSWHGAVSEIYGAWREYLLGDPHMQASTLLWSAAEQEQWPGYDLTAGIAYKGMPATVVDIRPANLEGEEFVVRTLFASASGEDRIARPVALTRVYALREDGRWVFGNALLRLTREWRREPVGPITYIIHPEMSFDLRRAERAVEFATSLASSLYLPELEGVLYVMAPTPEELHRAMGVDWTFGSQGHGYALPWNRLILSGDGMFGEDNRHELAHLIIGPLLAEGRVHSIVNEGLATWLGGSVGRTYAELLIEYAAFLREHPEVGVDAVLERTGPDIGWYPAGAVLVEMVYDAGDWPAVHQLSRGGRSNEELRAAVTEILGSEWDVVAAAWRQKVLAAASESERAVDGTGHD